MQIQIQSSPYRLSDTLSEEIQNKLTSLQRFYERIESCKVIVKKEKSSNKKNYAMEIRLAVPKADLFASEVAESYERALYAVIEDLRKQLIRHKDKLNQMQTADRAKD